MKNIIFNTFTVLCALMLLPLAALPKDDKKTHSDSVPVSEQKNNIFYTDTLSEDVFRILISETGKVVTLDRDTYITGVVAAEMPALYESEALKAQAVAAYTYAARKRAAANGEYDLTDDPEKDQCYTDITAMQKKWGDSAVEYAEKISSAVKAVSGQYLAYDNSPALTVYHALSSGMTESCKNVWGSSIPYLVSVESLGDRLEANYLHTATVSTDEMSKKLKGLCDITGNFPDWFSNPVTTESGRVLSIKVCGNELTGAQIAEALSLPSVNFVITANGNGFTVETRGRGHGVGMSQHGADYMAKQGSNYKDILLHYYNGCTLEEKQ